MKLSLPTISRPLLIFLSVLSLAGCKIVVDVPLGGSVVSASGEFVCAEATRCEIDVTDFDFSETYIAKPNPGWAFNGWEKRTRSLCGGKKKDCELSTSPLVGYPIAEKIVESDDAFYLYPRFTRGDLNVGQIVDYPTGRGTPTIARGFLPDGTEYVLLGQRSDGSFLIGGLHVEEISFNPGRKDNYHVKFLPGEDAVAILDQGRRIAFKSEGNDSLMASFASRTGNLNFELLVPEPSEEEVLPSFNLLEKNYVGATAERAQQNCATTKGFSFSQIKLNSCVMPTDLVRATISDASGPIDTAYLSPEGRGFRYENIYAGYHHACSVNRYRELRHDGLDLGRSLQYGLFNFGTILDRALWLLENKSPQQAANGLTASISISEDSIKSYRDYSRKESSVAADIRQDIRNAGKRFFTSIELLRDLQQLAVDGNLGYHTAEPARSYSLEDTTVSLEVVDEFGEVILSRIAEPYRIYENELTDNFGEVSYHKSLEFFLLELDMTNAKGRSNCECALLNLEDYKRDDLSAWGQSCRRSNGEYRPQGYWVFAKPGQPSTEFQSYNAGQPEGIFEAYYSTERLRIEHGTNKTMMVNGKLQTVKHGFWYTYIEDPYNPYAVEFQSKIEYRDGVQHGITYRIHYEDIPNSDSLRHLFLEGRFEEGKLVGEWKELFLGISGARPE